MNFLDPDSFLEKLLLQIITSVLTFSGALFVAYKVYFLNKKKEEQVRRETKESNDKETLRYIKSSLELTLPAILQQSEYFESLIEDFKDADRKTFHFNLSTNFQCTWIDSIDKINLRRVFFKYNPETKEETTIQYNNLINFSKHFNEIYNSIEKDLYYHIKGVQEQDELLKKEYLQLKRLIIELLNYYPEFPEFPNSKPNHISEIENLTKSYSEKIKAKEEYNYFQIGEFTKELKNIYIKHQLSQWMPEINRVLYLYEDLKIKYENSIGLLQSYVNGFEEGSYELKIILDSLNKIKCLST